MVRIGALFVLTIVAGCAGVRPTVEHAPSGVAADVAEIYQSVGTLLNSWQDNDDGVAVPGATKIDTVVVDHGVRSVEIVFSDDLGYAVWREENVASMYGWVRSVMPRRFAQSYELRLLSLEVPIEQLIPNPFRSDTPVDTDREFIGPPTGPPLVLRPANGYNRDAGLDGRHVALWPSHGWYYEPRLDRWEWMRARVFRTVEDLFPMAFIVPYLAPMLENAGAVVLMPRERDIQSNEAIVDNDSDRSEGDYREFGEWTTGSGPGFAAGDGRYGDFENPFESGTFRVTNTGTARGDSVWWVASVPESGWYRVTVSYGKAEGLTQSARYSVVHSGGRSKALVNQSMGAGTWVDIGRYHFIADDSSRGRVILHGSIDGRPVSADAVRFGGGMGSVQRAGTTGGRPRFAEAARYYMQFAGMPPSLVYNVTDTLDDYRDDYQSRGEWVNYLRGDPYGPNKDRGTQGLGIPIDLSVAFHTDAGFSRNDTTIGTLMIYSSVGADTTRRYPDGKSRFASRDFADMLQTQVVDDIRSLYDPAWRRRALWDKKYSEAMRPNVPAALLELLSHHNFLDMKFGLDPRFRFDASRAIYKGILRFVGAQSGVTVVVQPLPVDHMSALIEGEDVVVRWQPVPDPLEPSAAPTGYLVYMSTEGNGFDDGRFVTGTSFRTRLESNVIYNFRVTAVNAGGESLPSETVSACLIEGAPSAIVVNAFDRVAAPAALEVDSLLGFAHWLDEGVADRADFSVVGDQFNFDGNSPWKDDDEPGHGASYGNLETKVIAGNPFDLPLRHGRSIRASGYSFSSSSDESVEDLTVRLAGFDLVDLALGEEKQTPWPRADRPPAFAAWTDELQSAIATFVADGGALFASGAYIASDFMHMAGQSDSSTVIFASETLGMKHRTDHAATTGGLVIVNDNFAPRGTRFEFNTEYDPDTYRVESPDGIEPADSTGTVLVRYSENNISAAVGSRTGRRVLVAGFPFESLVSQDERDGFFRMVVSYLTDVSQTEAGIPLE